MRIQSPFYNPESGSKEGLNVKSIQRVVLIMGRYVEQVLLNSCLLNSCLLICSAFCDHSAAAELAY